MLLVVYGAEWCIWAHAFDKYIKGVHGKFVHTYSTPEADEWFTETFYERGGTSTARDAHALVKYVSENFVVVYIEDQRSEGGWDVINQTGANETYDEWLPYVFTVGADGRFVKYLDQNELMVRRDTDDWFRGYSREPLLAALKELREAAIPIQ